MKFSKARALLAQVPDQLPAFPVELLPEVITDPAGVPGKPPRFPDGPRRGAAVLILIYPDAAGDAYLVLTERSPGDHRHAGQISLPGGAIDADDASPAAAALREAAEEVGLDPVQAGVTVCGVLPLADVPVSGFTVAPVIAFAERPPELTPDGYEVASVFGAPLAAFVADAPIEIVSAERDGYTLRYGAYRVGDRLVWGATAMMLGRLGAFLGR